MSSAEVRARLVSTLRRDLVGPDDDAHEELEQKPSRHYLTGFLVPSDSQDGVDEDPQGELDLQTGSGAGDDERAPEKTAARHVQFPSSIGLSVLVREETKELG